ncbi:hypothetical protein G9F71_016145 [Clostridium sp. FP2]|uniref:hypothetical protein n=1 Tax=Clostridium sp. FP2 TaxID=2724481 RepID=UPI0013E96946|nr:hypothetical protein [Clostridium sp. FP2]MBZ9624384.1 hypothetical protein [Clostridium sp. FP2]
MTSNQWGKVIFDFCKNMPCPDIHLRLWKKRIMLLISEFKQKYNLNILLGSEIKITTRDTKLEDFLQQPIKYFYAKRFIKNYLNSRIHAIKECVLKL